MTVGIALQGKSGQTAPMRWCSVFLCLVACLIVGGAVLRAEQPQATDALALIKPPAGREGNLPRTRWDHKGVQGQIWTRAALSALKTHGRGLTDIVPRDIGAWCPAYPEADAKGRRAFWVGFLSALAKHESTYRADAVGGGGQWYGLLQILPSTARGYGCRAGSGSALKHGPDNLSCAIRIMARTVSRDGVVAHGMRGVAADWGPFHSRTKREDMRAWVRRQSYCKPLGSVRPKARPGQPSQINPTD